MKSNFQRLYREGKFSDTPPVVLIYLFEIEINEQNQNGVPFFETCLLVQQNQFGGGVLGYVM